MNAVTVLADAFDRLRGVAARAVDDLGDGPGSASERAALCWQPDTAANTIAWLVWHLARIQDDHLADVAGREQVWVEGDWAGRFGLDPGTRDTGFGHDPEAVRSVRPEAATSLVAYLDAVTARTREVLEGTSDEDLDRVVDESWDPPVTLGVRLVSVIGDGMQHAGQAAYVRGLWERR